ncbi:MAG TPA: NPCBM/NEW2 domain-containing protein [Bryobacteraceae bacterium]|nr:NPCBM/NEW2 domain-containing protein [Bryobacteraceae bacterium]
MIRKTNALSTLFALATCLAGLSSAQTAASGRVRYTKRQDPTFNRYTDNPTLAQQQWMVQHIWRLGTYSPYFDNKLSWFPNAWLYLDLYAIPKNSPLITQHPEWILKDAAGNRMYIPWECSGGTCPQYAGNIASQAFRNWWIADARAKLSKGYKGMWLDDVNMMFRVSNGYQVEQPPIDTNTGALMTYDNWRRYVAEFVEQINRDLSGYEILHNSIWFAGPAGIRDRDPYVQRQIAAADYINCERGVTDAGLTGGTGEWSLDAFLDFVDRVHAAGKAVIFDDYFPPNMEYTLASYFLISRDRDAMGDLSTTPDNWYPGYDIQLGTPTNSRYTWNNLMRRDFSGGFVLVNEPGAPTRTVTLPGTFLTVSGARVTSVSIPAKSGVVLRNDGAPPPPPPSGTSNTYYLGDMNWTSATNGWGPVEKNRSVGGQGAGDGQTIRLNGVAYARGLGTHAASTVKYNLGRACTSFLAVVGVDDEVGSNGSVIFQVLGDGVQLYQSPVLTGSTASANINVSVVNRSELTLVVSAASSGISYDHADWADAQLVCNSAPPAAAAASGGYLSDVGWIYSTNGWGPTERDRSNGEAAPGDGRVITLNGTTYGKGLGVHAPSEVRYRLNGACSSFQAAVGVDDEVGSYGSIVFQVWADGAKLYDSGVMYGGTATKSVNVSLSGRQELRLIVGDAGNGVVSDHGDWANARIICQ